MTTKTGKYVSGRFYSSVKYKAKKRGIDFADDLTIGFLDELLEKQNFKCFYSGLPIDAKTRGSITASLDRRDSSRGYSRDNICFSTIPCNMSKWIMSEKDFMELVKSVYEHSYGKNVFTNELEKYK